jgi:alpha-1,3-rhamnosyl/mannosyltransferase
MGLTTVALVAHRIADHDPSGIGRYYRELIAALAAEEGAPRLVAVTPSEPDAPDWLPAGVGRRVIPGPRRVVQFGWSAVGRPRVDRWTGGVDVVHALHAWAPVPTRGPLVVTVHDLMPVLNPGWYRPDHRWALVRGLEAAARHAARIVADSAWVASMVENRLGVARARISVVPLGVSDRFRTAPERPLVLALERRWDLVAGGYILAVGQVTARKNLLTVVRALASLGPEGSHRLPLVVAGSPGPASEELRSEAHRLGVADRLRLLGYLPDDLLVAVVAGARVLVHPSVDEGFGLTPIEAMAAGTPVIASQSASLPEVVGGAGILVPPEDQDAWAEALGRVIADDDERTRLVDAGSHRQAGFTWAATARRMVTVYRQVLADRSAR